MVYIKMCFSLKDIGRARNGISAEDLVASLCSVDKLPPVLGGFVCGDDCCIAVAYPYYYVHRNDGVVVVWEGNAGLIKPKPYICIKTDSPPLSVAIMKFMKSRGVKELIHAKAL